MKPDMTLVIANLPPCPHCWGSTADGRIHGRQYEDGPVMCTEGYQEDGRLARWDSYATRDDEPVEYVRLKPVYACNPGLLTRLACRLGWHTRWCC